MTDAKKKKTLRHQPRISGIIREHKSSAVHPYIEDGLKMLAKEENKSVSWIIAEIIGEFFGVNAATGEILSINKYTHIFTEKRKRA